MLTKMANSEVVYQGGRETDVGLSDNNKCLKDARGGGKKTRRVRFTRDDNEEGESGSAPGGGLVIVVHDTEPMTEEEFSAYFLHADDMQRFTKDMEDTVRNYVNYRLGRTSSFDHDSCTIRGLEEVLDHMKCNTKNGTRRDSRVDVKTQHKQEVLAEVRRQQTAGDKTLLDEDQVRQISLRFSEDDANRAAIMASRDAEEVRSMYSEMSTCSDQLAKKEDCQERQICADPVPSSYFSSEGDCLVEKNKSTRRGGRWALSLSRRKKSLY
jgi:hypothetical protein